MVAAVHRLLPGRATGPPDGEAAKRFLTALAEKRAVSSSTQQQALSALRFAFHRGRNEVLGWLDEYTPVFQPPPLPVVLSRDEVARVLGHLQGPKRLVAMLLYGSGCASSRRSACGERTSILREERSPCAPARAARIGRAYCRPPFTHRYVSISVE